MGYEKRSLRRWVSWMPGTRGIFSVWPIFRSLYESTPASFNPCESIFNGKLREAEVALAAVGLLR